MGNWVNAWRVEHAGDEPELNLTERARLKELEREVRELRMENEFLGKVALLTDVWVDHAVRRPGRSGR